MYYSIPEENLGSDISVLLCVFPGLADEAAFMGAQSTGFVIVSGDGSDGGGHSGGGGTGL